MITKEFRDPKVGNGFFSSKATKPCQLLDSFGDNKAGRSFGHCQNFQVRQRKKIFLFLWLGGVVIELRIPGKIKNLKVFILGPIPLVLDVAKIVLQVVVGNVGHRKMVKL